MFASAVRRTASSVRQRVTVSARGIVARARVLPRTRLTQPVVPSRASFEPVQLSAVPLMVPSEVEAVLRHLPREQARALADAFSWLSSKMPDGFGSAKKGDRRQSGKSKSQSKESGGDGKRSNGGQEPRSGMPNNIFAILAGLFLLMTLFRGRSSHEDGGIGGTGLSKPADWAKDESGRPHPPWMPREVTWLEVQRDFLAKGLVASMEVQNKEKVRVHLRATPDEWFVQRAARMQERALMGDDDDDDRHHHQHRHRSRDHDSYHYDEGDHRTSSTSSSSSSSRDDHGSDDEHDNDPRFANTPGLSTTTPSATVTPTLESTRQRIRDQMNQPHIFFRIGSVESFERQLEEAQAEMHVPLDKRIPVKHTEGADVGSTLGNIVSLLIFGAVAFMLVRGLAGGIGRGMGGGGGGSGGGGMGGMGRMFSIGQANVTEFGGGQKTGVTFKDVAGCEEAKREVMEFVQFLRDPERFTKLGAKIPKGAILQGPPGTGKTLLAKAVAGEADVPFLSISGSDFIEMFVGVGPSRVRDLFKRAREKAPCIVFIDEIDAVARTRSRGGFNSNDERENTLNQMLVEMDGFTTTDGVVVLAGTNRVDILDPAILRPGRFDRQITVDKPDIHGRKQIFKVHLAKIHIDGDMDDFAARLAALTPGFAGAEIANICNEAAIFAARRGKDAVDLRDFESATDRVIGGLEKGSSFMSPEERKTVAYHEAGHAVAGWFLEHADPLLKVTIVPRSTGALGFAQYLPKEVALYTKEALVDRMCMALGGRASEEINFGRITTGASDDLDKVTQMAYAMTTIYGMNPRIGQLSFPPKQQQEFNKPYSDKTAEIIDEEARALVDAAYTRTKELLSEHADKLQALAERLLQQETINQDDIVDVLGDRPFQPEGSYKDYLRVRKEDREKAKRAQEKAAASASGDDSSTKSSSSSSSSSGSGGADGGDEDDGLTLDELPQGLRT